MQLDTVSEELLHVRKQVRSTAPDYKAVKEMFSAMDHDGSGRLEPHEVKGLCAQLRTLVPVELSEAEMAAAVRRMDRDGDGDVDFNECEQCLTVAAASCFAPSDHPRPGGCSLPVV